MNVLLIAPNIDAKDVGEAFVAYKWSEAISKLVNLTVLTFHRDGRPDPAGQLPHARVVTWPEPRWARKNERINAMLKPAWPVFSRHVRNWLSAAIDRGERFDVAHQLMPQAARYATPLRNFEIPYLVGPLGGALETPAAFQHESTGAPLFTRLRALDAYRFRYDPWLRASYMKADCVLGVAPYVRDVLADIPLRRFQPVLELGIDELAPQMPRPFENGRIRLLHVGRGVRTKGLRDVVRALSHLCELPCVTLTSAGTGEEIAACRAEAMRLGVSERVTFLGQVPRHGVEALYESHDAFCFPSFREPAGGVIYEAMRHGLPVITAARGGPNWIIDDRSGIRIPVTDPIRFPVDIANAVRQLASNKALRNRLGQGARSKVSREGLWRKKAASMISLYEETLKYAICRRNTTKR